MRTLLCTFALLLVTATSAVAQNQVFHYDNTTAFTSRGASSTAEKAWIQRYPGDQVGGATQIHSHVVTLQDQDFCTPEPYQLVIYGNDSAGAATGEPDCFGTPIAFGNLTLDNSATCPGSGAFNITITWTTPISLPFQDCAVPANDIYVGVRAPAQPLWSTDGLSMHASTTEDENAATVGYTGAAGNPGLGWDINFTAGTKALGTSNRAWKVATRFLEDVVQPFASNPGLFGAEEPHFGYAGLFPDPTRGDQIGVRLSSSSVVGTSAWLMVSVNTAPATGFGVATGVLCLGNPLVIIGPIPTTVPASGPSSSEAVFGPAPFPAVLPPGVKIRVQGLTFPGPLFNISTMASILLP